MENPSTGDERFPKPNDAEFDDSQKLLRPGVEKFYSHFQGVPYQAADGKIYGPYNQVYYTPDLIQPWLALGMAATRQPCISFRERELSILATLSVIDTPYVRYAHRNIGRQAGLSERQIESALRGICPSDIDSDDINLENAPLTKAEVAVYELTKVIAESKGPIGKEDFGKASKHLDKQKIIAVVHFTMAYIWVCALTNIGDGEIPPGTEKQAAKP